MFSLFKKKQQILVKHQYKNLNISLPINWQFELEEGDLEACFDSKFQSTLRLHIMKVISKTEKEFERGLDDLTGDLPYIKNSEGLFFNQTYK